VALALSLYDVAEQNFINREIIDLIIAMTYSVVLFSIIVQGLTIKGFVEYATRDTVGLGKAPEEKKSENEPH
jgi:NhaP-type Na+/H+ or K+/H+ antiporter